MDETPHQCSQQPDGGLWRAVCATCGWTSRLCRWKTGAMRASEKHATWHLQGAPIRGTAKTRWRLHHGTFLSQAGLNGKGAYDSTAAACADAKGRSRKLR